MAAQNTYAVFTHEGQGRAAFWRQFAWLDLRSAEECVERAEGRVVVVDDDGRIVASSRQSDYGKSFPLP
jgi:hypothetical protein